MTRQGNRTIETGHTPRDRGAAMVLVMIAVILATVLAITFVSGQATSTAIAGNVRDAARARAVAESAATSALEYVRSSDNWRDIQTHAAWTSDEGLYGGTYRLRFQDEDGDLTDDVSDPVTISVIAGYGGATHMVSLKALPSVLNPDAILLLVVLDANALTDQEQARRSILESWGYQVNLASASAPASSLVSDAEAVDVVYVSGTVGPITLSQKLRTVMKGVVWERSTMSDDFGLTSAGGSTLSDTQITTTNSTHYITSVFAVGTLDLAAASITLQQAGGTVVPEAEVLSTTAGGQAVLIAADVRTTLDNGDALLGKRVALPLGGAGFEIGDLSDDGRMLVRRAVEWAALPATPLDPIAHWRFDEISGATAYDSVGTSDGTYTAAPTLGRVGTMNKSVAFDGATQYIAVQNPDPALNLTGAITITAWLWPDQWTGNRRILQKGNQDNQYRLLSEWGDFVFELSGVGRLETSHPPTDAWTHICATYDGATMRVYYNGVEVASKAASGLIDTSNDPLYLATKNPWAPDYDHFDGKMDDLRIYDYALTPTEILWLHDLGDTAGTDLEPDLIALYEFAETINTPNLVAHWPLDQSDATGGGLATGSGVRAASSAVIDGYDGRAASYAASGGDANTVLTANSTANGTFEFWDNALVGADSYVGAGGDANLTYSVDSTATVQGDKNVQLVNVPIADQASPGLSGWASDQTYASGTHTISSDLKVRNLTVSSGAVVTVTGDIRVQVTRNFTLNGGQVIVPAGSRLRLYVGQDATLNNGSVLHGDDTATDRLELYLYGGTGYDLTLHDTARLCGRIYTDGDFVLDGSAAFYGGGHVGQEVRAGGSSGLHLDRALPAVRGAIVDRAVGDIKGNLIGGSVAVPGKSGTSFRFDGMDDYAALYHDAALMLNSGSLAFWVHPDTVSGTRGLVSKDSSGYDGGGQFTVSSVGGQVQVVLETTSSARALSSSSSALTAGTWHHVVVSWGEDGLVLYVDGVEADRADYFTGLGTSAGGVGNDEPLVFGASSSGSGDQSLTPLTSFFDGRIDDVRFYDRGLDADQAANLYALTDPGDGASDKVVDTSGWAQPLDLKIQNTSNTTWTPGVGLVIDQAVVIQSPMAATKLYDAMNGTESFTLETKFTTDDLLQSGPAGIVSMSGGNTTRNFTLGQDDNAYIYRLRTENNTSNGTSPQVQSGGVIEAGVLQHLVVSYDGQKIDIYRNGALETTQTLDGQLNWDSGYPLIFGGELGGGRAWLGTLNRVAIYNQGVNALQAKNLFNGLPPGPPLPESVEYEFTWNEQP